MWRPNLWNNHPHHHLEHIRKIPEYKGDVFEPKPKDKSRDKLTSHRDFIFHTMKARKLDNLEGDAE
jgi:hypothetical protein